MGGWIAQLIASSHPERVERLVLFDSAGLYVPPDWDTRLFAPVTAAQLDALDALLMPNPPAIPSFVATDILRASRQTNWVVTRSLAQMFTGRDVTDALLPQLQMPVLLEWGAVDRIIPLAQGEKIHLLIPQSQIHVYAGCGHLAPLQCAGAMAPDVIRFLKQPLRGSGLSPSGMNARAKESLGTNQSRGE
jgi:pimeloyl-ACP methyl ester carboxylesterase